MTSGQQKLLESEIKRASRFGLLVGIAFGLAIGLAAGGLIGYNLGSDNVIVFTWGEQHQA